MANPSWSKIGQFEYGPNGIPNPFKTLKRVDERELPNYLAIGARVLREGEIEFLVDEFVEKTLGKYYNVKNKNEAASQMCRIPFPKEATHCYIGTGRNFDESAGVDSDRDSVHTKFKTFPVVFLKTRII